jgi:putative nucleotidyltransferase with HDIG domain
MHELIPAGQPDVGTADPFSQSLDSLAATQAQLQAYAVDLRRTVELERQRRRQLEQAYLDAIGAMAAAVEARDPYTGGHGARVASYAASLAAQMGWSAEDTQEARLGGLLHDIGKLGVDDAILRKPGRLEETEMLQMQRHSTAGASILGSAPFLSRGVVYALRHHERWDGRGYPDALAGLEIPRQGRLLAVADAYDAMTSTRPYRQALDEEHAAQEIARCAGTQFDPEMAHAFLDALRDGHIRVLTTGFSLGILRGPAWGNDS